MFQNCTSLQSIETSFGDAKNIRNISGMFAGCKNARKITPGIYYTDNLINMAALCKGCRELDTLYEIGYSSKYNICTFIIFTTTIRNFFFKKLNLFFLNKDYL